ncbi:MAG: M3 family metallopeptidase, partial [bacterium]
MTAQPPRWDLTSWFDGFGARFDRALDTIAATLADLDARADALGPLTPDRAPEWEALLLAIEAVSTDLQHVSAYASARAATDVTDEAAQAATARIASLVATTDGVEAPLVAALGDVDDATFEALCARPALDEAQFWLRRWRARAARSLGPARERLAADLGVDGLHAWARLYRQVTSAMTFTLGDEEVPLAWLRGELHHPEPARRAAALAGAGEALASRSTVLAAALNGIAGARLTLDRHRGVADPLDEALFESAMSRETLDAMMGVVTDHAELARRYLRLKARLHGVEALGWSDLRAPLSVEPQAPVEWAEARETVMHAFGRHHRDLARFADQMFAAGHVEAEPRAGKRPGAFCTRSFRAGESRVYMSYTGFGSDVRTLAHELGHAYHNHEMRDLRTWARQYPMTLAETASIVAETLVSDAQLDDPTATDAER